MFDLKQLILCFSIVIILALIPTNGQFFKNPLGNGDGPPFTGMFGPNQKKVELPQEPACKVSANASSRTKRKVKKLEKPVCVLPLKEFLVKGNLEEGNKAHEGHQFPPWMNLTLAQEGQRFAVENLDKIGMSHLFGLILVIIGSEYDTFGRDILLMTRNSDTPQAVKKRYTATMAQVLLWYRDPIISESQSKDSAILTSLRKVRRLHISAANIAKDKLARNESIRNDTLYKDYKLDEGLWAAFDKDLKASTFKIELEKVRGPNEKKVPVNQFMMAMTLCAFVCGPVGYPKRAGLETSPKEDLWAYNHLWGVLGYALGLDDEFNIALQPDLPSLQKQYQLIINKFAIGYIINKELDIYSKMMIDVLLKGFNSMIALQSPTVLLYRLLNQFFDIPAPNLRKRFSSNEEALERSMELNELNKQFDKLSWYRGAKGQFAANGIDKLGREVFGPKYDNEKYRAEHVYAYPYAE